jgi:hypothetical protein
VALRSTVEQGRIRPLKNVAHQIGPEIRRDRARKRAVHAPLHAQREFVALRDLTDCLLEAYDCIARRAYEKFQNRGQEVSGSRSAHFEWSLERMEQLDGGLEIGNASAEGSSGPTSDPNAGHGAGCARTACVLELPAAVDSTHSIAILSNGLLGIRMPKVHNANYGLKV